MLLDRNNLLESWGRFFQVPLKFIAVEKGVSMSYLSPLEREVFSRLQTAPRRKSWLQGRFALKHLLSCFHLNQDTSVLKFPNRKFSLSHSDKYAVAIASESNKPCGIGIDLEVNRCPHPESSRFFLSKEESAWLVRCDSSKRAEDLLRLWTIKEALFKACPKNSNTLLFDYVLEKPAARIGRAFLKGDSSIAMYYASIKLTRGHLSVALSFWRNEDAR